MLKLSEKLDLEGLVRWLAPLPSLTPHRLRPDNFRNILPTGPGHGQNRPPHEMVQSQISATFLSDMQTKKLTPPQKKEGLAHAISLDRVPYL